MIAQMSLTAQGIFKRLKPCPFCTDKAEALVQKYGWLIKCRSCPARMQIITKYRRQALAEWNNRPTHNQVYTSPRF